MRQQEYNNLMQQMDREILKEITPYLTIYIIASLLTAITAGIIIYKYIEKTKKEKELRESQAKTIDDFIKKIEGKNDKEKWF